MGSPTYLPLPRESTDTERMPLNPSAFPNDSRRAGRTCHFTINYVLILRVINFALALPAFIIFEKDAWGADFIAAEVFLMFGIAFNTVRILHTFISSVLHVDIEFSCGTWRKNLSVKPNGAMATHVTDALLAASLMISMIAAVAIDYANWRVIAPITLSFIVVALQYVIALPIRNPTFNVAVTFLKEQNGVMLQYRDDDTFGAPAVGDESQPAQTAEDLV
jgi:riboflavin transporter FmnP